MIKSCKDLLTKTLNPETLVREVAIATVERESWLRWPTITKDTTCKRYCNTLATTIGAAIVPTFFSSSLIFIHPHFPVELSSITAPFYHFCTINFYSFISLTFKCYILLPFLLYVDLILLWLCLYLCPLLYHHN